MSITTLSRKLRKAADALDDLMADDTLTKVGAIAKTLKSGKKKLHWTQTPAGKKKLAASVAKGWSTRTQKGGGK